MFRTAGVCSALAAAWLLMVAAGCGSNAEDRSAANEGDDGALAFLEDDPDVVTMDTSLSTDESAPGDPFLAHLEQPVHSDGEVVVPAGAIVRGRVSEMSSEDETTMTLAFTEIESSGETHPIDVQPIELIAEPSGPNDAAVVLGAGVGGVTAGTIAVMVRGSDVEVPPGQRIALRLESPAEIPAHG